MIDESFLFRVDAGESMGTGHFMRCLALAQHIIHRGGDVIFLLKSASQDMISRMSDDDIVHKILDSEPGGRADGMETLRVAEESGSSMIVADGYHLGTEFQKMIKDSGLKTLLVDDHGHLERYHCDLLLNQNLYAENIDYDAPGSKILLGPRYVLLRDEFWRFRNWERTGLEDVDNILVTLGGADQWNTTGKVVEYLGAAPQDFEVSVVVGSHYGHLEDLKEQTGDLSKDFKILKDISNMSEVMSHADIAVASGGTTSWELVFMGLPSMVVIQAENQVMIAEELERRCGMVNLGWHHQLKEDEFLSSFGLLFNGEEKRRSIALVCQELIDGLGGERVVDEMLEVDT